MCVYRLALVSAIVGSLNPAAGWARDISLVVKGDLSPYEERFISGAAQAGANLGENIKVLSPSILNDKNLVALLKRLVSEPNGSSVVVEVPWNAEIGNLLEQENIHGNVIWTSRLSGRFSDATNFVTWDDEHTGAIAADALATAVKTSDGKIEGHVLLVSQSSSAVEDNAAEGFRKQLAERYPDLKIVDTGGVINRETLQNANTGKDEWRYAAEQAMIGYITSDPKVVGVFASDPELTTGAAHAIENTKNKGKITLVGADLFLRAYNRATSNTSLYSGWHNWLADIIAASGQGQSQFIVQDPFTLGYQSVKAAFESSKGDNSYQGRYLQAAMAISGNEFQNALTSWSQGSGPGLVADPRVIPILYTTNRTVSDPTAQQFTGELDDQLHYGVAFVRVPDTHKFGSMEQHGWFSWDWVRQIFFGDADDDHDVFVIKRKQTFSKNKFDNVIRASTRRTAIIFVPGFRNTLNDGLFRFAQVIWDGQLTDMIPIVFSWPSRDDVQDYEYDGESAQNSVKSLESLIFSLQNDDQIDSINVIAHSMGNRVVVDAIADMFGKKNVKPLSEVILAALDVNKNHFLQEAKLIKESAKGVTLYASSADVPLGLSGDIARMPRAGFVAKDGPLVVDGVDSIDVTAMGEDLFALNHDTYSNSSVINDLALIIRSEIRPPNIRTARIRGVPEGSDNPRYWRYAN